MTIVTHNVETLVLVLVYVYFIKNFVADYCHSIEAISSGSGSLEKLKVIKILNAHVLCKNSNQVPIFIF